MKTLSRLLTISFFAAIPLLANVTYTYSGPLYTSVGGSYTTSMTITGYITFANALADNLPPGYYEVPTDWSFFDGVQTLSKAGGDDLTNYKLGTDALGNINDWVVTSDTPDLTTGHIQEVSNNEGGTQEYADLGASFGFSTSQGSWAASTAVPEPSTFAMLLAPLAWLAARRLRGRG
jgi:hypothetical protein